MPFQISAGVNISEIDLTTIVPAVQTTVGAMAGHFVWGPVDQRVLLTNETDLVGNFWKPNANTADDFFTAANFLAYSNGLQTVRVVSTGLNTDVSAARNSISNSATANTKNTVIKNDDDYNDNYSTGISGVGSWVAKYPGELGNSLKVSVCPSAQAWQNTLSGAIAVTTQTTSVSGNGTFFTTQLVAGDILELGPDRQKVRIASIANNISLVLDSKYTGNTITINSTHSSSVKRYWEFYNFFDVAPGTSVFADTQGGSGDELHMVVVDEDGQWTGVQNQVLERYAALSFASDAKTEAGSSNYYKDVINNRSKYIWWTAHNGSNSNAGARTLNKTFTGGTLPQTNSLIYGRDGTTPNNAEYINGYNKFKNAEEVDISFILGSSANTTRAIHLINEIAEYRKDCLALLSVERADVVDNALYSGAEAEDCVTFRNTLPSSSYYVLDQAWKYQYDKYNDLYRYVPGNGDVGGLMVNTDTVRDPWYSPAGFNRGQIKNAIKLAFNPNKAERDLLYKNGINPVVSFPGQGIVLFGDKTGLSKPSAFDRINVRRLFIVLEKAIATAAKFTLFEFNDEFTRANFVNLVEPFLRDVQGRRGIFDFRVVCNETNNTPEVIDRNEFVGDIYIKPARSINFIQLNFVAVRTGVEFSEIVGNV
jgi:phage tail sheath protein FI